MNVRYIDGTDLTQAPTVLDLARALARCEDNDGIKRLVCVLAPDGNALTCYERASCACALLRRPRRAPQWQGLAERHVAQVLKVQVRSAILYTFILEERN